MVASSSASQGTLGSAPFPSLCPSSSWYSAASLHALQSQPLPPLSGPMSTLGEDAIGPTPSCSGCPFMHQACNLSEIIDGMARYAQLRLLSPKAELGQSREKFVSLAQ